MRLRHLLLLLLLVQHSHTDETFFDTIVDFLDNFLTGMDLDNIMIITDTKSKLHVTIIR